MLCMSQRPFFTAQVWSRHHFRHRITLVTAHHVTSCLSQHNNKCYAGLSVLFVTSFWSWHHFRHHVILVTAQHVTSCMLQFNQCNACYSIFFVTATFSSPHRFGSSATSNVKHVTVKSMPCMLQCLFITSFW